MADASAERRDSVSSYEEDPLAPIIIRRKSTLGSRHLASPAAAQHTQRAFVRVRQSLTLASCRHLPGDSRSPSPSSRSASVTPASVTQELLLAEDDSGDMVGVRKRFVFPHVDGVEEDEEAEAAKAADGSHSSSGHRAQPRRSRNRSGEGHDWHCTDFHFPDDRRVADAAGVEVLSSSSLSPLCQVSPTAKSGASASDGSATHTTNPSSLRFLFPAVDEGHQAVAAPTPAAPRQSMCGTKQSSKSTNNRASLADFLHKFAHIPRFTALHYVNLLHKASIESAQALLVKLSKPLPQHLLHNEMLLIAMGFSRHDARHLLECLSAHLLEEDALLHVGDLDSICSTTITTLSEPVEAVVVTDVEVHSLYYQAVACFHREALQRLFSLSAADHVLAKGFVVRLLASNHELIPQDLLTAKQLTQQCFSALQAAAKLTEDSPRKLFCCYLVGSMLLDGLVDHAKDAKQAGVDFLRHSAEKGLDCAQHRLALVCRRDKQYEDALHWLRLSALQRNANAMNTLAQWYSKGLYEERPQGHALQSPRRVLLERSAVKAFHYFQLAANQGHGVALNHVANCYYFGRGVRADAKQAAMLYMAAAETGVAIALTNLGSCYYYGEGVMLSYQQAVRCYRSAAVHGGCVQAMFNYAVCADYGEGMSKRRDTALQWFVRAADAGHVDAQVAAAWRYELRRDIDAARRFYALAAAQGHADAAAALLRLRKKS